MKKFPKPIRPVIKFFTSLKLTVVLLAFALILTFFGTLAQVEIGLYRVQKEYFQELFLVLHKQPIPKPDGDSYTTLTIPMPGGYMIGILLLINLTTAFIARFKLTKAKVGIYISHLGLILLLIGQLFTELYQEESNIRFEEGAKRNYTESYRKFELAFVQPGETEDKEKTIAIPESLLAQAARKNKIFEDERIPFNVKVLTHYKNSNIEEILETENQRTDFKGAGQRFNLKKLNEVFSMEEINVPGYEVELLNKSDNRSLGKFLFSAHLLNQFIESKDSAYSVAMRFQRFYKPFYLHLVDFRHDKYVGTETPRNFSSLVQLVNSETGEDRPVNIRMNSPLRYNNETYYQASFDQVNPRITVLQCVRNPSQIMPYIACSMMTGGLLIQFLFHLVKFVGKQTKAKKEKTT